MNYPSVLSGIAALSALDPTVSRWEARGDLEAKEQTMTVRRLGIPAIVVCALLAFTASASARPPERFTDTEWFSEVLAHCDGFDLLLTSTGTFDGTVFFDQSGLDVKAIIRGRINESLTNSVTGKTVVNRAVFQNFFTRIDGTDRFTHTVSGFDFHGQVDGRGPILLQDVGRKVFDPDTGEIVFRAGHTNIPEDPEEAEAVFCAAVA
jgi:hypothetical protein